MMVPVSVLIITYNEEPNIRGALDSVVAWAREIFVVDSHSTDRTVEICEQHRANGVRVWQHPFENYAAQRNWALGHLPWTSDWVLVLDADERVSPELQDELGALFSSGEPLKDFYFVKRRVIFLGRWLRHATAYPFWIVRMFRLGQAHYTRTVNEQVVVSGQPGYLEHDLIHEDRKGLADWLAKHNRYSTMEADEYLKVSRGIADAAHIAQERGRPDVRTQMLKRLFIRLPCRSWSRFFYMYVWKRGFLDGKPGFIYCVLSALQEFHIWCKMYEKRTQDPTPASAGHAPEARAAHGECSSMTVPYVPVDHEGWVA